MKMKHGFAVVAQGDSGYDGGPGGRYHDLQVAVGKRGDTYRGVVLDTYGSNQGQWVEEGRQVATARSKSWRVALASAVSRARQIGIGDDEVSARWLAAAANECEDLMEEKAT